MTFQGPNSTSSFYTKLKTSWREVDAYGETPKCECKLCTCNINRRFTEREERLKVRKFLTGLKDGLEKRTCYGEEKRK